MTLVSSKKIHNYCRRKSTNNRTDDNCCRSYFSKGYREQDFLNRIIKYRVHMIGGTLILEAAILEVKVKDNKI